MVRKKYPKKEKDTNLIYVAENEVDLQKSFELAGQYQGDIVLTEEQKAAFKSKTGIIDERYRWPNREVPYEISAGQFCEYYFFNFSYFQ